MDGHKYKTGERRTKQQQPTHKKRKNNSTMHQRFSSHKPRDSNPHKRSGSNRRTPQPPNETEDEIPPFGSSTALPTRPGHLQDHHGVSKRPTLSTKSNLSRHEQGDPPQVSSADAIISHQDTSLSLSSREMHHTHWRTKKVVGDNSARSTTRNTRPGKVGDVLHQTIRQGTPDMLQMPEIRPSQEQLHPSTKVRCLCRQPHHGDLHQQAQGWRSHNGKVPKLPRSPSCLVQSLHSKEGSCRCPEASSAEMDYHPPHEERQHQHNKPVGSSSHLNVERQPLSTIDSMHQPRKGIPSLGTSHGTTPRPKPPPGKDNPLPTSFKADTRAGRCTTDSHQDRLERPLRNLRQHPSLNAGTGNASLNLGHRGRDHNTEN